MKTSVKFISALLLTATMSTFLSSCGDEPEVSDETDTDTSTDTSSSKPSNTINGHKFVDLGLPSGLLWADRNVGADSPYDYGDFFAWGETKAKTNYSWDTYKWGADPDNLTKYYSKNDKNTLDAVDDAATANWGNSCRMPTKAEFQELYDHCVWSWQDKNNRRRGYLITGTNGNSIFLPADGYKWQDRHHFSNSWGYYWSSSLVASLTNNAYYLDLTSNSVYPCSFGCLRYYGNSIRPVADKKTKQYKTTVYENNI